MNEKASGRIDGLVLLPRDGHDHPLSAFHESSTGSEINAEAQSVNEQNWWTAEDPGPMLNAVREQTTDRKLRLFAIACWRSGVSGQGEEPTAIDVSRFQPQDVGHAELEKLLAEKLGEEETTKRSKELLRKLWAAEGELEKGFQATSAELSKRVLHPLLERAGGANCWIVCPDADVWLIPWPALVLPDGKYFVEQFSLRQAVSGRDLLAAPAKAAAGRPLVVANPNYSLGVTSPDKARPNRQTPLKAFEEAARGVLPHLKKMAGAEPEVYFGDQATEEVVKAARAPRFVLLGTHGVFIDPGEIRPGHGYLMENPLLRCTLCFAGCDRKPAPGDTGEDGLLVGVEVLGCDFRGTELVVLSACQTARGDVQSSQAAIGMRSSFLLAGARAVTATLWSVDVKATVSFTEGLFERLAGGHAPDIALVESQRTLIATWQKERGSAHPFYWAAYTLTGVGP